MSEKESEFIKSFQKTLWQVTGLLIFAVVVASVSFYFTASKDIDYLKDEVGKKADKQLYELTVKEIKEDVKEIKQDIKFLKNESN